MANDTGGNVQVDFIYGNMPMQPDDQRLGDANSTDPLDPTEGDHDRAVSGYLGFPQIASGAPYNDLVDNKTVPNVVGMLEAAAEAALVAADLVKGAVTTTATGANVGNDLQVKTQTPAAGTVVNEGASVALLKYQV